MNILLIVDDYLPHSTKVAAKMMHELALEFMHQEHLVTMLVPDTNKNYGNLIIRKSEFKLENFESVPVIRFPSGRIKNINKIVRLINEFLLPYRAWKYAKVYLKSQNYDLVVYYSPSIFWSAIVTKLKNKYRIKSYLILRDFFPQWAIDSGLISEKSLITKFFRYFEKKNYKAADKIGIQSPGNIDLFLHYFPNLKNKVELLYNWADTNPNNLLNNNKFNFRSKWNLQNKILFFYGGNIGHAQDMKNLLFLAESMEKSYSNAFFLFIGSGDETDLVQKTIKEKKLSNSLYLPSISQSEFKHLLDEIDIGLFSLHPDHKSHNFPGKLLGYMQASKPILGCVNKGNDLMKTIHDYEAGYISISGEHNKMYESAIKLLNTNHRIAIGKNANRLLLEKFSANSAVENIIKFL
ncbi:MAG: glycosyltransferase family 4 protein [Leptospira sp.]|nr:glycosyltransferase family 4 protein [Leptospira sp.]